MDSSFAVKPRDPIAARTAAGRSNVVRTELAPSQSVNAARQAAVPDHTHDPLLRDPSIDPQCQTVLDREREQRQRRRARNDEILQRQKAYGRSADPTGATQDDQPHADFEV